MTVLALIVPLGSGQMPVDPGYGVPAPPSGGGAPVYPSHPIAMPPVYPSQGFPVYPIQGPVVPMPPVVGVWPPPGVPTHPIAPGGGEGGETDPSVGISNPIAGGYVLIWHPLHGFKLVPAGGLPPLQAGQVPRPGQPLPPTAEPKK
jgi:hypothetical protein